MTEEKLKYICDRNNAFTGNTVWLYWCSELYSFGKYIRKYGYYPRFLPLAIYCDHSGPSFSDEPYLHEIETDAPVFLTHRKIKTENYISKTSKRAYTFMSPSVFYRRSNNIIQVENPLGTVAFPVHSLPSAIFQFDIEKYCKQLKNLPEEYHPIRICLHMHDIVNESFRLYEKNGFEVVTAGNTSDYRFIERLYDIMKVSKHITSNDVGTITFLAVEMRISFFVYGPRESTINISDKNFPKGERVVLNPQYLYLKEKLKLIENYKPPSYDNELIYSIESSLGIYDGVSRRKMFFILYWSLFNWIFKCRWIFWLRNKFKNKKIRD